MGAVLNTKAFLERVWPETGPYYIAVPAVNKETGKAGYWHYGYDTIEECVTKAQALCFVDNKDVYFVVHAVKVKKKQDPTGKFMRADRTHDNMREAKVFFADLDVGEEEEPKPGKAKIAKYETQEAALSGLERFIFRTGLPRPLVVQSGGGFHIYWILSTPLDSLAWRDQADRLRFLFRKHGLKNDPMRTTDQSSVLRVAGTKNLKPHVQAPVRAIDAGEQTDTAEFLELLAGLTPDYEPLAAVHRAHESAAGGLVEFSGRHTPVDELFTACAQMRRFEELEGNVYEPEWYNNLGLLRWATGGELRAHKISSGYPGYDEAETQMKMDQWENKNPPTCRTMHAKSGDPSLCEGCIFFDRGSNALHMANKEWEARVKPAVPIQLAATPTKAERSYTPVALSAPYGRVNGGLGKYVQDPEEKIMVLKIFAHYDMFPLEAFRAEGDEDAYSNWVIDIPKEGKKEVRVDHSIFGYLPEFSNAMRRHGVFVPDDKDQSELRKFMLHYLRQLQVETIANDMHNYLGWVHDDANKIKTFVLYERAWNFATNKFEPCAMAKSMQSAKPMFATGGTLADQVEALKFFATPEHLKSQYAIMTSMLSPYFFLTGEAGMIVSLSGETSSGKTTTARTMAGLWGPPDLNMMSGLAAGSTFNAKIDRMMLMNNLPFIMDEFTKADPKEVNEIALIASQGQGKVTLTKSRDVRIHRSGHRSNVIGCTTNDSLIQLCGAFDLAGSAAQTRIVEILYEKYENGKVFADRALRKIMANYGWIGPAIMELLLPDHDALCEEIRDMMDQMTVLYKVKPMERFRVNHLAPLLVIGRRAAAAGLIPFDADEVVQWFVTNQLKQMRDLKHTPVMDNDEAIANFIMDVHGETLRIETDPNGNLKGVLIIPHNKVAARLDITAKRLTFSTFRFKRWCDDRRINSQRVLSDLRKSGKIIGDGKFDLAKGVESVEVPRTHCHTIDVTKFQAVVAAKAK